MPDHEHPRTPTSRTGDAIREGIDAATAISKFSPQQVITAGCIISMIVINGLYVWGQYDNRNDRRDERGNWIKADAERQRSYEDGRERDRQTLERVAKSVQDANTSAALAMQKEQSATAMAGQKEILAHCTEEGNKNRKALNDLTAVLTKLLSKKGELPDEPQLSPTLAPMPRCKAVNEIGQRSPSPKRTTSRPTAPPDPGTVRPM